MRVEDEITAAAIEVDSIDVSAGQTHLRALADMRRLLDGPRIDDASAATAEPQLHENAAGRRPRTLTPLDVNGTRSFAASIEGARLHVVGVERCLRDTGQLV